MIGDDMGMLPQEPWKSGKARSGPVSGSEDRPTPDISSPSGPTVVSRMLNKPRDQGQIPSWWQPKPTIET